MNLTSMLRPLRPTPSYEDMVRGGTRTGLADALRAMQPGDVLDVTDLTNASAKRQAVQESALAVFGRRGLVSTSIRDGRLYVARLYQQDARRAGGAR